MTRFDRFYPSTPPSGCSCGSIALKMFSTWSHCFGVIEPQQEAIESGLRACERLRQLLVTLRSPLVTADAAA